LLNSNPDISIIIPVLHEAKLINSLIEHLHSINAEHNIEIIVVDGSPSNDTLITIKDDSAIKLTSHTAGRALQMNTGANAAQGHILLFLHADTRLPPHAFSNIITACSKDNIVGGAFQLSFNSNNYFLKLIAFTTSMRSRITRIPYGDQAIFIKKYFFHKIGAFSEMPLMEDVDLMKRIRKRRAAIIILKDKVVTSHRKWQKEGLLRTTGKNYLIRLLYLLGINTNTLKNIYYK
jgi:rSAM/selenodomain-associated transferase 2